MRSTRPALVVGNLLVLTAIIMTRGSEVGRAWWHDEAAYALLLLTAVAALPLLRHRRPTTLVLASAGAWSTLTGVFVYFVSPRMPAGRWMIWWHAVTSAAFFLAFLAHWARNQPRLATLARKAIRSRAAVSALLLVTVLVLAGAVAMAARAARRDFVEDDHGRVANLSFLALPALAALGLAFASGLRRRAALDPQARHRARAGVDVALLVAMWLATLTGVVLLYATRWLRTAEVYWLTVAWHVVVSILLVAIVAAHAAFNARPLASHAK